MAIRIFDQTIGQTAGISVVSTGKGAITNDGLEAYAQMVVSASGQPISSVEGAGNLVDLSGATVAAGSLSFSANSQFAIIDTQGFEAASLTVSGFGTATLAVQWSNLAASGFVTGSVTNVNSGTSATSITADGQYSAVVGGRYMKILVTAFTTGPIVVTPVLNAGGGSGSGSGGATATANAVAPTYVEASTDPLSLTLRGGLRSTISNGANEAAVKAASTAPVATDPALVVAISPNGQNANGQATMANSTPVVIASNQTVLGVGGEVANDGVDSGNPVKIGGIGLTAQPTAVSALDRVNATFDVVGKQVVIPALRLSKGAQTTVITTSTAETTIVTAGAAGVFNDLYGLLLSNISATALIATLKDATSGTTRAIINVPAAGNAGFMLEAGSAIPQSAAAANWTITSSQSVTSLEVMALFVATKA